MKFLRAFGRFWYDFIVGDDWKIAVAVVGSLLLVYAAMRLEIFSDTVLTVVGGIIVVTTFTISLLVDVRHTHKD